MLCVPLPVRRNRCDLQGVGVDDPDAVAEHVGGEEPGAVGGEADVLGHGAGARAQAGLRAAHVHGLIGVVAPGVWMALRLITLRTFVAARSTTRSLPLNSHEATKKDWSAE